MKIILSLGKIHAIWCRVKTGSTGVSPVKDTTLACRASAQTGGTPVLPGCCEVQLFPRDGIKSFRSHHRGLVLLALLLAGAAYCIAEDSAVALQNGDSYKGASDTYFYDSAGNFNYGKAREISFGKVVRLEDGSERNQVALLRFDLSPLAGQKAGGPATLSLVQVNLLNTSGKNACRFSVFEVSPENADWVEGTESGEEAMEGSPTWSFKAVPATMWAGAGGLAKEGADYDPIPVAEADFKETDGTHHVVQIQIPAALIQKWIDQPELNGGLLFVWQSGDPYLCQFRSSEWSISEQRPLLEVKVKP